MRLEQLGDLVGLDDERLEAALEDAALAWGTYSQKTYQLGDRVDAERERRKAPNTHEEAVVSDPDEEEVASD